MNQADEDALIESCFKRDSQDYSLAFNRVTDAESIRLAIRAAYARGVAEERERAARVADEHAKRDFMWGSENSDRYHTQAYWAERIAAAIRRGE